MASGKEWLSHDEAKVYLSWSCQLGLYGSMVARWYPHFLGRQRWDRSGLAGSLTCPLFTPVPEALEVQRQMCACCWGAPVHRAKHFLGRCPGDGPADEHSPLDLEASAPRRITVEGVTPLSVWSPRWREALCCPMGYSAGWEPGMPPMERSRSRCARGN